MASFTDRIAQFNPYVQQLPVEAMVEVGLAKQQKYEQNIQKIQAQIDSVAGMDILRDQDKQYLQSKLNQLGQDLKFVAAGDFSNFQLANSVGGMVTKISKDENVQNAVSSTAKYRREYNYGEQLKKEGKWSANREYDFNKSVSNWLSNPEVGASFDGKYVAHTDVTKKVTDFILKMVPNAQSYDMPYVINSDGSINYRAITSMMKRSGIEEVDAAKIKSALSAVLDSNDYDELNSMGRYFYRDATPDDLKNLAIENYKSTKDLYEQKLDEINQRLLITSNPEQRIELNQSKKYYSDQLGKDGLPGILEQHYGEVIKSIGVNPDGIKGNLYTKGWIDQVANGFSYRKVKDEFIDNPRWKEKEYDLKLAQFDLDKYYKQEQLKIDWEKARKMKDESKSFITDPYRGREGDPTLRNLDARKNWDTSNALLVSNNKEILKELAKDASTPSITVSPQEILSNINSPDYVPRTKKERRLVAQYKQNQSIIANNKSIYDDVSKTILANHPEYEDPINNAIQSTEQISDVEVNNTVYSNREILNLFLKGKFLPPKVAPVPGVDQHYIDLPDDSELTSREIELKKYILNTYFGTNRNKNGSHNDSFYSIEMAAAKALSDNSIITKEINNEINNKLSDYTTDFATEWMPAKFEDSTARNNFISAMAGQYGSDLKQKGGGESYNPEDELKSLGDQVEFSVRQRGSDFSIRVNNKKSGTTSIINVTRDFVEKNLNKGYINENFDISNAFIKNNGSTSTYKTYDTAYYPREMFGYQLPNGNWSVTLPISANLINDDGYIYPELILKTPNGEYPLIINGDPRGVSISTFPNDLQRLDDATILKLYKAQYPNIEELLIGK